MLKSVGQHSKGLTLVELMVVVAILAIIAAIGYPMYTQQVQKSRRADARSGVMEISMIMEQEFATWGGYSEPTVAITGISNTDGVPAPDANSNFHNNLTRISDQYSDFYAFTINATDTTYTITAVPAGVQVNDAGCTFLAIDQTGDKTATNVDLCW